MLALWGLLEAPDSDNFDSPRSLPRFVRGWKDNFLIVSAQSEVEDFEIVASWESG